MTTKDTQRAAFEYWFSDEGSHPKAIERSSSGGYILAAASQAWDVWQAATEAAKATSVAVGDIDADAEMAKVNHDVELMGVGFLVDGKRCSLDRITWFNRPGDTWLPPPPGYPAPQPMTMSYVQAVPDHCDRITWRGAYYHLKEGAEAARQPALVVTSHAERSIRTWKERCSTYAIQHMTNEAREAISAEIADLRSALAATAAPVLSDEQRERIEFAARILQVEGFNKEAAELFAIHTFTAKG